MPNDKRSRPEKAGNDTESDLQNELQREEAANREQDENPQRGENWSNYRTRELSTNDDESSDQNVSNNSDDNPQDGANWSNYRTREMSGNDENFYRNRERGNYDEGQTSDDDGSGGSLY